MKLILAGGAAAALVLGALSGHAMHPDLWAAAKRPAGPQILADGTDGAADTGAAFLAAYHGTPPDYVLGTDTTRPGSWLNGEPAVTRARYDATPHADDPDLYADADDTTAAERDPNDPSREPAYERSPVRPAYDRQAPASYRPAPGYNRPSYERPTYDRSAFDRSTYDRSAYDRSGYPRPAYDRAAAEEDEADDGPTGA